MTLNSKHRTENLKFKTKDTGTRKTKTLKEEKLVLQKEYVENVDFYKPVLNKIITTRD